LLHRKDRSRIIETRFCTEEDVEVPWKEIVKGYQYAEDFAKVRVPATRTFGHLAALEPFGEALVLTTMRYAHEIRRRKDLDLPAVGKGWAESEMKLARQLVQTLSGEWDPSEYRDTYSEALRRVIEAKLEGKETTPPEPPEPAGVTDLMEALKRSLEKRPRRLAKAAGGRRSGRKAAVA